MTKRLLILSFSPINRDPRVLRQANLFSSRFDVVTCGYGPSPEAVAGHIQIPDSASGWGKSPVSKLAWYASRRYADMYENSERVRTARAGIERHGPFDGVLANDAAALPLATSLGLPVHADLHEYAMGTGTTRAWKALVRPFLQWAAEHVVGCASASSVAPGIAARYEREFGIAVGVVPNSPAYRADLTVRPTGEPIRLVHVGAGAPARSLDLSIDAVKRVNAERPGSLEFDLYLVPGVASYIDQLRRQAGDAAVTGVRLREPVAFNRLIDLIHEYDVGLFFAPPVTYNIKHVLPNKFFEFVQARVGVIIGPSIEMVPYLRDGGFGVSTADWEPASLVGVLAGLTPAVVDQWKTRSDHAAWNLSAEVTSQFWVDAVDQMMERRP